jgi:lipopolysaccharide heptosyltransferase II
MIAYLEFAFVKLFLVGLRIFPPLGIVILGKLLGTLAWRLDARHRKVTLRNLRIAFGNQPGFSTEEKTLAPEDFSRIGRESFIRFSTNALFACWLGNRPQEPISRWFTISGKQENLVPAHQKGKGVILVLFHLGNWEALTRIASEIPEIRFSAIFQPLRNPYVNQLVAKRRGTTGVQLMDRHRGFQDAIKLLRSGDAVVVLADQHAGDHGMWIPFFNRLASTTTLPALLAKRTGATLLPVFCRTLIRPDTTQPHWHLEFGAPIPHEDIEDGEIMSRIHSKLENEIRREPQNWFWMHQRWKTPSPNFLLSSYRRGIYLPPQIPLKPFKILIRTPNWLGDTILSLPAIQAIKRGRPDAHITLLTPHKLYELWPQQGYVDQVATSIEELRGEVFDAAVLLPNSIRSAIEAWRLKIPVRTGYRGHQRRWLLTSLCPQSYRAAPGEHEVKNFCGLARWLGAGVEEEIPKLELDPQLSPDKIKAERRHLVVHPGAAHGSAKRWIEERFVKVLQHFNEESWIIVGTKEEKNRNQRIAKNAGPHVRDLSGQLPLHELVYVLAWSRLLLCNDSGPMHLAAAVGTPVVAIFGSTEPIRTGPLGPSHKILHHPVECSPCFLKECPIDLRCMKAIEVDYAVLTLRTFLNHLSRTTSQSK